MTDLTTMRREQMKIQIASEEINGVLIDAGKDIIVLYDGENFLYISLAHIYHIQKNDNKNDFVEQPSASNEKLTLSIQQALTNAKDTPCEMFISKNLTFHGYITNNLDDYIAFYSPVHKVVYISNNHFKWLIPYHQNTTPYTIDSNVTIRKNPFHLKVNPSNIPLQPTLEEQLKKEEGRLVIFDGGVNPRKVGLINLVANNFVELILATGETACINIAHIKCVQLP